jgi:hypothetical protein
LGDHSTKAIKFDPVRSLFQRHWIAFLKPESPVSTGNDYTIPKKIARFAADDDLFKQKEN